jgi:hypothetical protein
VRALRGLTLRRLRLGLPEEQPDRPPVGHKAAFVMLSADGTRIGFRGLSVGGGIVYGVTDDARCAYGRRHRPPVRSCGCGFYCLHDVSDALALTCASEYREAAVLEVAVLGRYIRYERGYRSERQRVRRVLVGYCRCGRRSEAFTDAGTGVPGWRALTGSCASCAGRRPAVPFHEFARLAGTGLQVVADDRLPPAPLTVSPLTPFLPPPVLPTSAAGPAASGAGATDQEQLIPQLAAEAVLLQARLDWFQEQLGKLTGEAP